MLERMKNFITQNQLFEKNQPIICATSGGVDSICLIHLLKDLGYKPILAHVNHHKRVESEIEKEEMVSLAKQLQIPFELFNYYDSNIDNFQNNAHHARYNFFKELADKYHTPWIATAHHLDDQAETILMRLCSGSNLYGYAGISICLEQDNYRIARPLLFASKNELYEYAKKMNYTYFEDASNKSDDYFRNRLRHHILPDLKKETPALLEKLQEFSIQAKEAFQFIRNQSIKILNKQNNIISVEDFLLLDIAIQKDIICLLLERYHISKNKEMIENCWKLICQNQNKQITLNKDYCLKVEYGFASIEQPKELSDFLVELNLNHTAQIGNQYLFYFSKKMPQNNAKYLKLCYNGLKLPFLIRNQKDGDWIELKNGSKKVSRIWIDAKIPKDQRKALPLVFDGSGNLLWIYPNIRSHLVAEDKQYGDIYLVCEEMKND